MKYGYETNDGAAYKLLLEKAKYMRNHPTEAEAALWPYLAGGALGAHFRRQHPIAGYIPDFVCLSEKLIVEIDGGYHFEGEQPEQDAQRTAYLESEGYSVIRFTNEEVLSDIDNVLEIIKEYLSISHVNATKNESRGFSEDKDVAGQGHPSLLLRDESVNDRGCAPLPLGGVGGGFRVGMGYDVHRLVEGRELWLGGIRIEHSMGLMGHSDADVLIHAICDALLGAANMRDIGYHFPDTSAETDGMDSKIILRKTVELLAQKGWKVGNIDATVCAERPKINPHVPAMRQCMAEVMQTDPDNISIKATTTERLGFTGREEGMSAYAVALIVKES